MKRAAHIIAALLLAAACEPAAPERDGAPAPAAEGATAPGELAGAASAAQQIIIIDGAGAASGPDRETSDKLTAHRRKFMAEIFTSVDPVRRGENMKELT
jgi:hypothetical protein